MKQVVQDLWHRRVNVEDVPRPRVAAGAVLIRNACSLISPGTEGSSVRFGASGLLSKALQRPDLVRSVVRKVAEEGIAGAARRVIHRLDVWKPLGYCCAGTVIEVGDGIHDLNVGDRVAAGGGEHAVHAEYASIPRNLCAPIPDDVSFEAAAFATLGAIALHALRTSGAVLGESVLVVGLGLVGQLTVRMARRAGCNVIATDLRAETLPLASSAGARHCVVSGEEALARIESLTAGRGVDAAIVTAAASDSAPLLTAVRAARDRAVVVLVGDVPVELPRSLLYEKELTLKVSRSYGPGRYDPLYEEKGRDYPLSYVRWTENRNLEAVLDAFGQDRFDPTPYVHETISIHEAEGAYRQLLARSVPPGKSILIRYPGAPSDCPPAASPQQKERRPRRTPLGIGVIGAGTFACNVLIPALRRLRATRPIMICSRQPPRAQKAALRFGFPVATSDPDEVIGHPDVDLVVVATPHHLHAALACRALAAGKAVLVEKPLCLTLPELEEVERSWAVHGGPIAVGFNRRHAPLSRALTEFVGFERPLLATYRINAGKTPDDHWIHDPEIGGGRLLGECCHFLDLVGWLVKSPPRRVYAAGLGDSRPHPRDSLAILVEYRDGSVATVQYLSCGDPASGKERLEVFVAGRTAMIDDFRFLETHTSGRRRRIKGRGKGHAELVESVVAGVLAGDSLNTDFGASLASTRLTLLASESLRRGRPLDCDNP